MKGEVSSHVASEDEVKVFKIRDKRAVPGGVLKGSSQNKVIGKERKE